LIEAIFSAQDLCESFSNLTTSESGEDKTSANITSSFVKNLIVDARPTVNAVANRAMGAGFESTEIYKNCKRLFMGIDNIHIMRESLSKLIEGTNGTLLFSSSLIRYYSCKALLRLI
jgi:hypothetical protein